LFHHPVLLAIGLAIGGVELARSSQPALLGQ